MKISYMGNILKGKIIAVKIEIYCFSYTHMIFAHPHKILIRIAFTVKILITVNFKCSKATASLKCS